MIIKNACDLNEEELESFRLAYIDYFKHHCIEKRGKLPMNISRYLIKSGAERFSDEVLRRIKCQESTSFVAVNKEFIEGFITGYVDDDGIGRIAHIYANSAQCAYRTRLAMELYKSFALAFKRKGVSSIVAKSEPQDVVLLDTLESLDFDYVDDAGTREITYEKRI